MTNAEGLTDAQLERMFQDKINRTLDHIDDVLGLLDGHTPPPTWTEIGNLLGTCAGIIETLRAREGDET